MTMYTGNKNIEGEENMRKNKITVFLLCSLVCLGLVFILAGCGGSGSNEAANGSKDPFYFYNQVQLGQPKSEVDAALGVKPEEKEGTFLYTDDSSGFGVVVTYDASDMVSMKTVNHDDDTKVMDLSDAKVTEDQLASISKGMTYDEVKSILGSEGLEIIRLTNPVDPNTPATTMIWFNDDHTGFYIVFAGEKGTVLSVKYWK